MAMANPQLFCHKGTLRQIVQKVQVRLSFYTQKVNQLFFLGCSQECAECWRYVSLRLLLPLHYNQSRCNFIFGALRIKKDYATITVCFFRDQFCQFGWFYFLSDWAGGNCFGHYDKQGYFFHHLPTIKCHRYSLVNLPFLI